MKIEMVCCESTILQEIANPKLHRKDVAQSYRLAMESSERSTIDWAKVNAAIIARWSKSGLIWIKEHAHSGKCFA